MSKSDNISAPQESTGLIAYKALDERLYDLNDEERSFLKEQSGIQDDDELKEHIIQIQTEAYKVGKRKLRKSQIMEIHVNIHATGSSLPLHPRLQFRKVSLGKKRERGCN